MYSGPEHDPGRILLHNLPWQGKATAGGSRMKQEKEKQPKPWEMVDPKPPVIQSGHMENRVK